MINNSEGNKLYTFYSGYFLTHVFDLTIFFEQEFNGEKDG